MSCLVAGILVKKKKKEGEKKRKREEAFIPTRNKAGVISTDFMQICHRHKSTAVHGLTFLYVTSKHFSEPLLSLLFGSEDKCLPYRRSTMYFHPLC